MAMENPYKYTGPLDPEQDELVCIPRDDQLDSVLQGIRRGDYWAVFGPRQMGKTTFLRQIQRECSLSRKFAHCMYLDFEAPPATDENFYQWFMDRIQQDIPCDDIPNHEGKWKSYIPEIRFFNFLETFTPKDTREKIILMLDEIERIPSVKNFLHLWRRVYHERYTKPQLNRYSIIITGSADLIGLTLGATSPFNIAKKAYLKDFTHQESRHLLTKPFDRMDVQIEDNAATKLISQVNGHPQLLQHACSLLADTSAREERELTERDVDAAMNVLFRSSTALDTLERQLDRDENLNRLLKDLLAGKTKKFFPYRKYALTGAGPVAEQDGRCIIRNKLFETFLRDILEDSDATGDVRYKKIEEIGHGAMGKVYKAEDLALQRIVSLKILGPNFIRNEIELERFYAEARATAQLFHTNIVMVYDVGQMGDEHFIAMEFIEGVDLMSLIENKTQFTPHQVIYIAKQMIKALAYSHRQGIVHRDIKPKNIMINRAGEVKIVDFGIASVKNQVRHGDTGYILGSPYYISPEQIRGDTIDQRIDLYATGVTLFHLITGDVPYKGDNILMKHLSSPTPSLREARPDMPEYLDKLVSKCMEKDKYNRYRDAPDLLEALKSLVPDMNEAIIREEIKLIIETESGAATLQIPKNE